MGYKQLAFLMAMTLVLGFSLNSLGAAVVEYTPPSGGDNGNVSGYDSGDSGGNEGGEVSQTVLHPEASAETPKTETPADSGVSESTAKTSSSLIAAGVDDELAEIRGEPVISGKRASFAFETMFKVGYMLLAVLVFIELLIKLRSWTYRYGELERWIMGQRIRGKEKESVKKQLHEQGAPVSDISKVDKIYKKKIKPIHSTDVTLLATAFLIVFVSFAGIMLFTYFPETREKLPITTFIAAIVVSLLLGVLSRIGPKIMLARRIK